MRRLQNIAMLCLFLFCVQAEAVSQAHPTGDSVLRIVVLDLPPYGMLDEDGNIVGLNVELGEAIAIEAGLEPEHRIAPLARALDMLRHGEVDMCIFFPSKTAMKVAVSAGAVAPMETVVWGRSGTWWHSFSEVERLHLAQVRSANYDDRITYNKRIDMFLTSSYSHSLEMLFHGRVDGVVGPRLGLQHAAEQMGHSCEELGEPFVLSVVQERAFVSRHCPHLERLRHAVKRLQESGVLANICSAYE